jgi:DNA-binding transcriptional LysR family regulator
MDYLSFQTRMNNAQAPRSHAVDRLSAMQTFVRVVERGSFSAVARESRSTQSAVSKQVAALEAHLGARLLARTTRALTLTEAGQAYFEQARRLVADVEQTEAAIRHGQSQLSGWLRIAASQAFGQRVLFAQIRQFQAEHPGLRVDLKLNDGFIDLVEQGIDVAIRIGELADSSLVARPVGKVQRAVMASRDYLRAHTRKPLREPEDLLAHDCIIYSELATGNDWSLVAGPGAAAAAGSVRHVRVAGSFQTNSSSIVREALLAGVGLSYSPTWLVSDALADGRVERLLPDWTPPPLPLTAVSPRERRDALKVRAFVDHFAAYWAELH